MSESHPLVMLSAGEASGDRHAASLYRELKALMPNVSALGMGSDAMREAGVELVFDSRDIGVIGLIEVLRHYREIRAALRQMQQTLASRRPDLLICVDYKEFNFRLAKTAKSLGIKVLFYVSPQVWAWRPGRVEQYGRIIDHMAVIFPFELPFYEAYGVPATYVGHPLAGKVHPSLAKDDARLALGLPDTGPLVGLLPGSRTNEIRRLLPVILEAAKALRETHPDTRFLLFQAASLQDETLDVALGAQNLPIERIRGQDYNALQLCDAVITVSGTATLEVALLHRPMVIVYRLSALSYWLGRLLVKVPFIGLPNILAGRGIVREFIQHEATAANMADEIAKILDDADYRTRMTQALLEVKEKLGSRDGSKALARLAADLLNRPAVVS